MSSLNNILDDWFLPAQKKAPFYSLILDVGRAWLPQERPINIRPMQMKQCFRNAGTLALEHKNLTYVEGIAVSIIPIHHAWCIDEQGRVVDPTWQDSDQCLYLGIAFETEFMRECVIDSGHWGLMLEHMKVGPLHQLTKGINLELHDEQLINQWARAHGLSKPPPG